MMKWIPYGPNAWMLHFAERVGEEAFARGRAIAHELEQRPPADLLEFVPGFTTVLLEFDPGSLSNPDLPALAKRLARAVHSRLPPPPLKEIPVIYDGPDLERVADAHHLDIEQVRQLHSAREYKVYLLGFSPGFPYLGDLDPRLHTPRLESPRLRVRAGSVAIGGEHTGIYSVDGPGGWNVIGHTTVKLFDPAAAGTQPNGDSLFFLKPGDRVKFVRIDPGQELP
jgi:KipI family sensor histidine kinase inhibitor